MTDKIQKNYIMNNHLKSNKISEFQKVRINKSMYQSIYLLDVKYIDSIVELTITGSTLNIYTVKIIDLNIYCNCPDIKFTSCFCKHICFVLCIIGKLYNENLFIIKKLCPIEKENILLILRNIHKDPQPDIINSMLIEKYNKEFGEEKIKYLDYVAAEDKPALYNLAKLFVYPSFYEGFGFPLLEAMASGTPVITGLSSSLGEIVGQGGLLVDPYNANEITAAMAQVLTNEKLRNNLIQKGLEQAKKFSWAKTAEETLKLFKNL